MRRTIGAVARIVAVAIMCVLLIQGARVSGSAADRDRRGHEIAARELDLYRQIAEGDTILDSQRRAYMERFRTLEAQLRDREQDLADLRARLGVAMGGRP